MKNILAFKIKTIFLLSTFLFVLSGCDNNSTNSNGEVMDGGSGIGIDTETIKQMDRDQREQIAVTSVTAPGPYGEISIGLAEGWTGEAFGTYENETHMEEYGITLGKEGEAEKALLLYYPMFGVCGTGMTFENVVVGEKMASMGYESHDDYFWGYVALDEENHGIVLLLENVSEDWWTTNREELLGMLESVQLDTNQKTGQ